MALSNEAPNKTCFVEFFYRIFLYLQKPPCCLPFLKQSLTLHIIKYLGLFLGPVNPLAQLKVCLSLAGFFTSVQNLMQLIFLEMIPRDGCRGKQSASTPRTKDCLCCKRCESAHPTDFLSIRVYLWHGTTSKMQGKHEVTF